mmetsp:Transcript_26187/g.70841  ORF Transcript_26187/g.70841 Transcript_26187/m.70841 type:complete len:310 (+) Transcript_26187:942-1871(+)
MVIWMVVKLGELALALGVAQQGLGAHHNQGLAELAVHLSAQDVEEVGRCGDVDNLPVGVLDLRAQMASCEPVLFIDLRQLVGVLVAHLQEALQACRGVFWPLAVVTMGQQAHEASLAQPLGLARAEELVKDDLCGVGKVSKLRLPQHQAVGVLHAVAQLKAQDAKLRQGAVADSKLAGVLPRENIGQGHVAGAVLLVMDQGVPVAEGATLHILATEAHVVALTQQGGVRQRLCHTPVHALASVNHVAPGLVHLLDLLVGREVGGELGDCVAHLLQELHVHACVANARQLGGRLEALPVRGQPVPWPGDV